MIWQFHLRTVYHQVSREAGVDCALAELYTKSLAIESTIQEQKHAEVLTKLYVRMNEVTSSQMSQIVCTLNSWWVMMHSRLNAAMLTTADCVLKGSLHQC